MLAPAARRAPRRALGAGDPPRREAQWRLPRSASRSCSRSRATARGGSRSAGPAADAVLHARSASASGTRRVDASFSVSGDTIRVIPSRNGTELDVRAHRPRSLLRAATSRAQPRRERLHRPRRARAHDEGGARDGHRHAHGELQDLQLGNLGPHHEPPPRRHARSTTRSSLPAAPSRSTRRSASGRRSAGSGRRR